MTNIARILFLTLYMIESVNLESMGIVSLGHIIGPSNLNLFNFFKRLFPFNF